MPRKSLYLARDPEADTLLTKDPLAFLVQMVLDHKSQNESIALGQNLRAAAERRPW